MNWLLQNFERNLSSTFLIQWIDNIQSVEDKSRIFNGAGICVEGIKPSWDDSLPRANS